MVIKIIVLVVVIYIIYSLFFRIKRNQTVNQSQKHKKSIDKSETMVECQKCSVFLSAKEAIIKDGKYFCSKECAKDSQ